MRDLARATVSDAFTAFPVFVPLRNRRSRLRMAGRISWRRENRARSANNVRAISLCAGGVFFLSLSLSFSPFDARAAASGPTGVFNR